MLKQEQTDLASEHYQKALELNENSCEALNGIGVTYMLRYLDDHQNREHVRQAIEKWRQSLKLDPHQPMIQKLIQKYSKELHVPEEISVTAP
jgi:tetratricopeptide (TPR) repeat protein